MKWVKDQPSSTKVIKIKVPSFSLEYILRTFFAYKFEALRLSERSLYASINIKLVERY